MNADKRVVGFKVTAWHGEGRSLFYLCEVSDPQTWEIIGTYRTREKAEERAKACRVALRCGRYREA